MRQPRGRRCRGRAPLRLRASHSLIVRRVVWGAARETQGKPFYFPHLETAVVEDVLDIPMRRVKRVLGGRRPLLLCSGRKPPLWAVKRPARPHKRATQKPIYCERRSERFTAPGGPGYGPSPSESACVSHSSSLPPAAAGQCPARGGRFNHAPREAGNISRCAKLRARRTCWPPPSPRPAGSTSRRRRPRGCSDEGVRLARKMRAGRDSLSAA